MKLDRESTHVYSGDSRYVLFFYCVRKLSALHHSQDYDSTTIPQGIHDDWRKLFIACTKAQANKIYTSSRPVI